MGCKYLAVWIWTAGYGFLMLMLLPPKKKRSAVEICMHVDAAVRRPLDSSEMHRQARAGAGQGEREGEGEEPREAKLATHKIEGKRDKNPKGEKQKAQLRRRWAAWTASASQFEGKMQMRGGRHRCGQAFSLSVNGNRGVRCVR